MSDEKQDGGPCESHDVHLWPQTSRDGYAPTVHGVTEDAIGINVGGLVIVQPIRTWHAQAQSYAALEARCRELEAALREAYQISHYGRGTMQDIDDVLERAIRGSAAKTAKHED